MMYTGDVVARVCLDCLIAEAYEYCFWSVFETLHSQFEVGKSLLGVILDMVRSANEGSRVSSWE